MVHFDYHLGNVLVAESNTKRVSAIVDWDGARGGDVALDLAVLAYDLRRRELDGLADRVERHLLATTGAQMLRRIWAHVCLRMVDWSIRHHPRHIERSVRIAGRFL